MKFYILLILVMKVVDTTIELHTMFSVLYYVAIDYPTKYPKLVGCLVYLVGLMLIFPMLSTLLVSLF